MVPAYDIVVATRNRPMMLSLSLPLLVAQQPPPRRIVVIDSSDEHEPVRAAVQRCCAGAGTQLIVRHTRAGLTYQRNQGLALAKAPIVMFPDDDALAFPGVAAALLRVYARDPEGNIGGVCAAFANKLPPSVAGGAQAVYRRRLIDRIRQAVEGRRKRVEDRFVPDPFIIHGRSRWHVRPVPPWLSEEDAVQVEWMTGLCMTYRTEVIRSVGFDEVLRRYALFEDVEASFSVAATHLIVGARRARLFHYRAPGQRADGMELGATQLLNKAYIVCKHASPQAEARRWLRRYGWYKLGLYLLGVHSRFGHRRAKGLWRALRCLPRLTSAPASELAARYQELLGECIDVPAEPASGSPANCEAAASR